MADSPRAGAAVPPCRHGSCAGDHGGASVPPRQRSAVLPGEIALKLGILSGDAIGHEVVHECVKVMKAAAAAAGLILEWQKLPIGKHGHEAEGNTLPPSTEKALWKLDGWIMGPIGHAAYPRNDPTWVMPPVRKKYELLAAIRPSRAY